MVKKSSKAAEADGRVSAVADVVTREIEAERTSHKKALSAKNRTIGNLRADKRALLHRITLTEADLRKANEELKLAGGAPLVPQINEIGQVTYVTEIVDPLPLAEKEE